jgi:hypothetical protein
VRPADAYGSGIETCCWCFTVTAQEGFEILFDTTLMDIKHSFGSIIIFESTADDTGDVFIPDLPFTIELADGTRRIEGIQLRFD